MKKVLVAAALLLASAFVFANESIVDNFFRKGQVVKIIENDTITYVSKSAISRIKIVKDEIMIGSSPDNYVAKKSDVSSDNNGNIVITKK